MKLKMSFVTSHRTKAQANIRPYEVENRPYARMWALRRFSAPHPEKEKLFSTNRLYLLA